MSSLAQERSGEAWRCAIADGLKRSLLRVAADWERQANETANDSLFAKLNREQVPNSYFSLGIFGS